MSYLCYLLNFYRSLSLFWLYLGAFVCLQSFNFWLNVLLNTVLNISYLSLKSFRWFQESECPHCNSLNVTPETGVFCCSINKHIPIFLFFLFSRCNSLKRRTISHLSHHMSCSLPSSCANVLIEGDVEMRGWLIVLDHVKQSWCSLKRTKKERKKPERTRERY